MSARIPKTLYHYCSVQTFFNIMSNRSIWLSDVRKSNDSQELCWMRRKCREFILRAWVSFAEKKDEAGRLSDVNFEEFYKMNELLETLIDIDLSKCWVFCVSEKKDNLGQWRGYGDDGKGISIGFKRELFELAQKLAKLSKSEEEIYFQKISYTEKEIKHFFDVCAGLSEIKMEDSSDSVIDKLKEAIATSLVYLPFFKNESFKEEKEWRLAYSMDLSRLRKGEIPHVEYEDKVLSNLITIGNYSFISKNDNLISHVELSIPQIEKFIDSITIGPKSAISREDVVFFLISKGILKDVNDKSIQIKKSIASYQ